MRTYPCQEYKLLASEISCSPNLDFVFGCTMCEGIKNTYVNELENKACQSTASWTDVGVSFLVLLAQYKERLKDNPSKFFSALQLYCSCLSVGMLSHDSRLILIPTTGLQYYSSNFFAIQLY